MSKALENVKFRGSEVELQNMTLVIPPLNFKAFREHGALKKLQVVIDGMKKLQVTQAFDLPDAVLDAAVELTFLAAKRNYPDISKEQIEEGLDFDNIGDVIPKLVTKNNTHLIKQFADQAKNE